MEPMFKIELPGLFTISGSTARVTRSKPSTLDWNMVSQSSSRPVATVSRPCAPPALLRSTSTLEVFERTHSANFSTLAVLLTSSAWPAPGRRISAAIFSRRSARRAPSNSWQPWVAKARAAASPKPLEAPVINTHLPDRDAIIGKT